MRPAKTFYNQIKNKWVSDFQQDTIPWEAWDTEEVIQAVDTDMEDTEWAQDMEWAVAQSCQATATEQVMEDWATEDQAMEDWDMVEWDMEEWAIQDGGEKQS